MTRARTVALVVAVLVIAANLRPAVVGVSPLVAQIRGDLGINSSVAGLLTALPVLCFGLLAPFAARWTRRWGLEATLLAALVVLVAGILVRLVPALAALLAGSVLVGAAIAVGNTLMPAVVKRDFPHRTGPMTGAYSMAISGGGAIAAAVMVPIEQATGWGWRPSLALWAAFAAVGIVLWLPWVVTAHRNRADAVPTPRVSGLWGSALAWQVTLFMGLQSLQFYALTAWVPTLFVDHGVAPSRAGLLLSLAGLVSLGTAYLTPVLAARRRTQYHLVAGVVGVWAVGYAGLLLAPVALAPLWMVLVGLGQGAGISLGLTLITLRSPDSAHTSQLSGMAQGVGYVIAAFGPLGLGALHDASHGWSVPMIVLIVFLVPLTAVGLGAARDRHVGVGGPRRTEPVDAAPEGGAAGDERGRPDLGRQDEHDGWLRGHVRRPDGSAVAHATVTLVDEHGHEVDRADTDPDGAYLLHAPPGAAVLICAAADHSPAARRTSAGRATDVELRPRAGVGSSTPRPRAGSPEYRAETSTVD